MYRLHLRTRRNGNFADRHISELQRNPCSDVQIVPRGIAAAVQIDAYRGSTLEKILSSGVAAGNKNGNGTLNACAAAQFNSRINARRCSKKSLAQVFAPPLRMGLTSKTAHTQSFRDCEAARLLVRAQFVQRGCGTQKVYKLHRIRAMRRIEPVISRKSHLVPMCIRPEKSCPAIHVDHLAGYRAGIFRHGKASCASLRAALICSSMEPKG